jgi:hypothetical protein
VSISLFQAFAYCESLTLCKAEFKDQDSWLLPSSIHNDTDIPSRNDPVRDHDENEQAVNLLLITPSEGGMEIEFEEQYIDINDQGIALVKDCTGRQWAFRFRMYKPVTEQEVREHQVRQLISR